MGVLGYPLLHLNSKPKRVNAEGDDGKQHPFDIVAEKLCAGAVEGKSVTVDNGVLSIPSFLYANSPGCAETKSKGDNKPLQNANADHSE